MKLVVDLPETLVRRIKDAVDDGGYEDAREFVTTSIENQLEIEDQGDGEFRSLDEAISQISEDTGEKQEEPLSDGLGRLSYDAVETVPEPDEERVDAGPLWGQYNRLFPVKLVVRRLGNQLQQLNEDEVDTGSKGIRYTELDQFSQTTADVARKYGLEIKSFDEERGRSRGEKLSSALPTGDDPTKSKGRFRTHFVGYPDRNGNLTGAPATLLLVNMTEESVTRIGLTDAGLEFAELWNPLLDDGPNADRPLSSEEREFYLEHVRDSLPDEYRAMLVTARNIDEGVNRPDPLSEEIGKLDDEWSEAQANTVRSGIVSRLFELGLLERERVGRRGTAYTLTGTGQEFLSEAQTEA